VVLVRASGADVASTAAIRSLLRKLLFMLEILR
jgi:hypothetical protein